MKRGSIAKRVAALASQIVPGAIVGDVDTDRLTDAEGAFVKFAHVRGKKTARNGWPDFLVVDADGGALGVEIKQGGDRVTRSQEIMFAMLEEHVGMRVFIWDPARPDRLTPWRNYEPSREHERRRAEEPKSDVKRVGYRRMRGL